MLFIHRGHNLKIDIIYIYISINVESKSIVDIYYDLKKLNKNNIVSKRL